MSSLVIVGGRDVVVGGLGRTEPACHSHTLVSFCRLLLFLPTFLDVDNASTAQQGRYLAFAGAAVLCDLATVGS